jgi:hypothetical protein
MGTSKPSFKSYFKDYGNERTSSKWKSFTAKFLTSGSEGHESASTDDQESDNVFVGKVNRHVHMGLVLAKGPGNVTLVPKYAVFPKHASMSKKYLPWQKQVVRAMFTDMYSEWTSLFYSTWGLICL